MYSRPNFISQKIFDKNFVAVHQIKTVLILKNPVYVGFCILELSKLLMYNFIMITYLIHLMQNYCLQTLIV